jgi:hypothetical protein
MSVSIKMNIDHFFNNGKFLVKSVLVAENFRFPNFQFQTQWSKTFNHQIGQPNYFFIAYKIFGCYLKHFSHPIDINSISTIDLTIVKKLGTLKKNQSLPKKFSVQLRWPRHFNGKIGWLKFFHHHLKYFFNFHSKNVLIIAMKVFLSPFEIFQSSDRWSFNLHHWFNNQFFLVVAQKQFGHCSKKIDHHKIAMIKSCFDHHMVFTNQMTQFWVTH